MMKNCKVSKTLEFRDLKQQLPLLVDVAKKGLVRKVTSIRTICDAINETPSQEEPQENIRNTQAFETFTFPFRRLDPS